MKTKRTIEISAHELTKFLKEKLNISAHITSIDIATTSHSTGSYDNAAAADLKSVVLTWEEGSTESEIWSR
jgi:hypothetical protein